MPRQQRLDPAIFHLPVEKMREGYYSDKYFVRTRELLLKDDHRPCVTMQVFGKAPAFLGGIDEAIAILKLCSMEWPELEVYALYDGDEIAPWETVLLIEGPYDAFAHLETLYLGVLARRTKVGTTTGWSRPGTGTPRTSRARSVCRPTRRLRGGAPKVSARCPTRSSPPTAATRCSRRRSSPSSWTGTCASSPSSTSRTTASGRPSRWRARWASGSMACGSTRRRPSWTSR